MKKLLLFAALLALSGCGGNSSNDPLTVSAAASLKQALPKYESSARYSFAGSDQLAAQIRAGAKPDVFAAANTKLPDQLFKDGLTEKPKVFATNRLVIAVPKDSKIHAIGDLGQPGLKLAIGAADVPVGSYTREVLAKLDLALEKRILANVKSNEPDVSGVVGKISQGAVDAGFVYVTDVKATGGKLNAVQLPASISPEVAYGAAVVKGTKHRRAAQKFVEGLKGAPALKEAGFGTP